MAVRVVFAEEGKAWDGYYRYIKLPMVPLAGDYIDILGPSDEGVVTVRIEERYWTNGVGDLDLTVQLRSDPPEYLSLTWEDFGFTQPNEETAAPEGDWPWDR